MLPRLPNQTATIKVNLKRRLQYKSNALSLTVRPNKVIEAAIWLINNSNLYKEEGIVLNQDWLKRYNENFSLYSENSFKENEPLTDYNKSNTESPQEGNDCHDDKWSEEEQKFLRM